MRRTTWHGCYDDSWKGLIVDDAFAHPAKMARGLVARIFEHLLDMGAIGPGSTVIDPFGGIGTTAIEGASRGCRVICCELEPKFVELAKRNFELHRRTWESCGDPLPVMVQGDSRRLVEALGPVLADVCVASPPFAEQQTGGGIFHTGTPSQFETYRSSGGGASFEAFCATQEKHSQGYGSTTGNLGNLPPGSVADVVVSSPPWENQEPSHAQADTPSKQRLLNGANPGAINSEYGMSNGQLGNSTGETFWSAARQIVEQCHAILKPSGIAVWVCKDFVRNKKRVPFSDDWRKLCEACGFEMVQWIEASLVKETEHATLFDGVCRTRKERKSFFRRLAEKKGSPRIDHEDVLIMRKVCNGSGGGLVDAAVSSPPYSETFTGKDNKPSGCKVEPERMGRCLKAMNSDGYGITPGQLGAMKSGTVDEVL